jgi:hypothetical protein
LDANERLDSSAPELADRPPDGFRGAVPLLSGLVFDQAL